MTCIIRRHNQLLVGKYHHPPVASELIKSYALLEGYDSFMILTNFDFDRPAAQLLLFSVNCFQQRTSHYLARGAIWIWSKSLSSALRRA